ncbi:hypothetical protein ACFFRR_008346 [Megaselia abdita]
MQSKTFLILLVQILAVHGVTYYFSGKPKPWLTAETTLATPRLLTETSRTNNVQKSGTFDGNILYAFDTPTGIYAYQSAAPKLLRTGMIVNGVEGSYSYTSPDGSKVTVTYTADENGYHPKVSIARH